MPNQEELLAKLKAIITDCDKRAMPMVCERITTPNGLTWVENRLINMVTSEDGFTVESALAHLESELNESN
jgi:hypothetical protein